MFRIDRLLRATWLVLSVSLITTQAARSESFSELIEKGKQLQRLGDDEKAVDCFTKAIKLDPKSAEAYRLRGDSEVQWALGSFNASADFTQAVGLDPNDYHSSLFRGFGYLSSNEAAAKEALGRAAKILENGAQDASAVKCRALAGLWLDPKTSLPNLKRWTELYPADPEAWFYFASTSDLLGKKSESQTAYTRSLALLKQCAATQSDANLFRMLSRCYTVLGKRKEGIDWLADYRKRHPESIYASYWRGFLLVQEKRMPEALRDLNDSIKLGPIYVGHLTFTATTLMSTGQYRDAAGLLHRAMLLSPNDDTNLAVKRATCLKELGMTKLALTELNKAMEFRPGSVQLLRMISEMERPTDPKKADADLEKALKYAQWAISKNPENVSLYLERIELYELLGKPTKAIGDIETAIKQKPSDPALYHKRANLKWTLLNQRAEAIADETRAIELASATNKIGYLLARASYGLSLFRYPQTLADANACIAIDPDYGYAYRMRALVYLAQNQFEEAVADLKRATRFKATAPDDADYLLARAYAGLHKDKEELTALNTSLARNPRHLESLLERGRLYIEMFKNDAAAKDLNEAIEISPSFGEAYYMRSRALAAMGEYSKAIADISESMSLQKLTNAPWLLEDRARYFTYAEQYKQAAQDMADAYRYDPGKPSRKLDSAKLLYRCGEKEEAIAAISQYLRVVPDNLMAVRARARCYFETKQYENSIADYTTLLTNNPENPVFYKLRAKAYLRLGDSDRADIDKAMATKLTSAAAPRSLD